MNSQPLCFFYISRFATNNLLTKHRCEVSTERGISIKKAFCHYTCYPPFKRGQLRLQHMTLTLSILNTSSDMQKFTETLVIFYYCTTCDITFHRCEYVCKVPPVAKITIPLLIIVGIIVVVIQYNNTRRPAAASLLDDRNCCQRGNNNLNSRTDGGLVTYSTNSFQ